MSVVEALGLCLHLTLSIQGGPNLQDTERLGLTAKVFTTTGPSVFVRLWLQNQNVKYLFI